MSLNVDVFMSRAVELLPASAASCFLGYIAWRALFGNKPRPSHFTIALWFISSWLVSCLLMVFFDKKPSTENSWPLGLAGVVIASLYLQSIHGARPVTDVTRTALNLEPTGTLVRRVLLAMVVVVLGFLQYLNTLFDAAGALTIFGPVSPVMSAALTAHPAFILTMLNLFPTMALLDGASSLWIGEARALRTALEMQAGTIVVPILAWFVYWATLGIATDVGQRAYPMFAEHFAQRAVEACWVSVLAVVAIVLIKKIRVSWDSA